MRTEMSRFQLHPYGRGSAKIIVLLVAATVSTIAAPGWYATGGTWTNRRAITLDHTKVTGTHTDFPVLIALVDDDFRLAGRGGAVCSTTGGDILFTAGDGLTKLAHEIEAYDSKTGLLTAWVKVPQLSASTDTTLYVYFGNSSAKDESNRAGVWNAGFFGVYHLSDANSGDLADSTAHGATLLRGQKGRPALDATGGKIGGAQLFGANHGDFALLGSDDAQTGPATLSFWLKRQDGGVLASSAGAASDLLLIGSPDANTIAVRMEGANRTVAAKVDTAWNHVAVVRNGTSLQVFFNGILTGTFAVSGGAAMAFRGLGSITGTGSFAGSLDEVRWSHVSRTAEWIATEYANQSAPGSFARLGTLEPALPTLTGIAQLFQKSDDAAAGRAEDISKRTVNSRTFKNADGSFTAVIGRNMNADDGKGNLTPALASVWQDGAGGWQLKSSPFATQLSKTGKGHDAQHVYTGSDGKPHTLTLGFPSLTYVRDTTFRFALGKLNWTLVLNGNRSEFSAVVTASQGPQTYNFGYELPGGTPSVNGVGALVGDDGVTLSRAVIFRADGLAAQCSAWSLDKVKKTASFSCDDSSFPAQAYPYVIDPTVTPPVANLQSCRVCNSGQGGCVNTCTGGSFQSAQEDDPSGYFHDSASWTMDTSSVPAGANVTAVTVSSTNVYGSSGNYQVKGAGNALMAMWTPQWGASASAPTNGIVKGGVTSFTGDCGNCGGWYDGNGNLPFSAMNLWDFSMSVTYGLTNYTFNSNPQGRLLTVDGFNFNTPYTFQWAAGSQHTVTASTQDQGPGRQWLWQSWSDGGAATHTITAPASDTSYSATFSAQYYVNMQVTPGGTVTPPTGWYPNAQYPYLSFTFSATPYLGYPFVGFSGDYNGTTNPMTIPLNGPKTITATFAPAGSYAYSYIDRLSDPAHPNWGAKGSYTMGGSGFTSTDASNGGTLLASSPGGRGEVQNWLTLAASGGTYTSYLLASSDAQLGSVTTGTFYAAEVQNPTFTGGVCTATLAAYKVVNGSVTALGSTSIPCRSGMVVRLVATSNGIAVYADGLLYLQSSDTGIGSGAAGLGVRGAPAGNSIAQSQIGPLDTLAPTAVPKTAVATAVLPNRIDFHLAGTSDNAGGTGVAFYCLSRPGWSQCSRTVGDLSDATVSAGQQYTYQLQVYDYHLNVATTTLDPISAAPVGAVDIRRVGVRGTGAYYGGMGENIDVRSGNLNFTLPLLKAQGRGGWKVPVNLTYNSQNWRQDGATSWNLGEHAGYGYGWRVLVGSLTPVWGASTIHHYTFTDSTGAEYVLGVNTSGVWTSTDTFYGSYDSNAGRLYFNDGSFWVFGSTSGGAEADAGVMYPTLLQDTNGNQIAIRYAAGAGMMWTNTSGRIVEIEDVRAVLPYGGSNYVTYSFSYDGNTPPRLSQISNNISTSEGYTFGYSGPSALTSPYGGSFGTTTVLSSVTISGVSLGYGFTHDGAGNLTKVTFPYGGYVRWGYGSWTYSGSRSEQEITSRWISKDGVNETAAYNFTHGSEQNNGSLAVHGQTVLADASGNGGRTWTFAPSGATAGLLTQLERYNTPKPGTVQSLDAFTWTQDAAGRWYVGTATSTADGVATKKTVQTVDGYGNTTQVDLYDYGNLVTPARSYVNTYKSDGAYLSRYIRNRLVSTVLNGSLTLVSNTYDTGNPVWVNGIPADLPNVRQHDAAYGTGFTTRGNLTASTTLAGTSYSGYDIGGNVTATQSPSGTVASAGYASNTNYAAPGTITTGSLSESLTWSAFLGLGSATGPNGDASSTTYDSYARPASSTSPAGAVTTYSYASSAPWTVTATTGGKFVKTTLDGFGRTIKSESGNGSTVLSVVETTYDPCACSPMGKTSAVSMPHAPGAGAVWTSSTYDGLGRTTRVTNPDGSHKDYVYSGNTVQAADEAGAWKKYTQDAFGSLTQVEEPNPAGGSFFTSYTYDLLGHLTGVSMPRPSGTQTRTFNYTGAFLMSATNPETGTVTYTYSQSRLASKTDAKGQRTEYSYDDKDRVTQIRHYPNGVSEDTCQRVDLTYDSNAGFTYLAGRLATRVYHSCVDPNNIGNPGNPKLTDFTEMYGYSQAGQVTNKRLRVARTLTNQYQQQVVVQRDLDGSWTYDSEGKMTSVTYPAGSAGPVAGTYTVGYDAMSRPRTLTDPQSAGLVTDVSYGSAGELLSISGLYTESRSYNSRLQLTALNGVTFTYPGSNNGKIQTQYDPVSGETITYQYDSLNRLISAIGNGTWGQTYAYDGFGNLTAKNAAPGKTAQTFSAAFVNNQQVGLTYDANGNQLTAVGGGDSLKYDVENRLWWGQSSNASNGNGYGYSPSNERVYKSVWTYSQVNGWSTASEEITYWGIGGQRMGSYTLSATLGGVSLTATGYNVYFGSKLVRKIDAGGSATIVKADRLGSFGKFAPYGEERTPTADNADKFATYYRDGDTGLDYAVNRYYASGSGRFLTPDPGMTGARPDSPGSWNRFAYVQGDPMKFFDPSGRNQASPDVEFCGAEFEWWQCSGGIGFVSSGEGSGSDWGSGGSGGGPFCAGGSQFAPSPGPIDPLCAPPPPPPPPQDCSSTFDTNQIDFVLVHSSEAQFLERYTGIRADVMLGWGAFEGGWGIKGVSVTNNNFFGWTGPGDVQCVRKNGFGCFSDPGFLRSGLAALTGPNYFSYGGHTGVKALDILLDQFSIGASISRAFDSLARSGYTPDKGYGRGVAADVAQVGKIEDCLTSKGLL